MKEYGRLKIIATPIGNLDDISHRALSELREADFILCEDTRITKRLLDSYDINNKLVVFSARDEEKKIDRILEKLKNGETAALVSDAGTPTISDPGVRLVNACWANGIEVTGVPGPSAIIYALSISGLPTNSFVFEGFIPQKKGRQKKLKELTAEERTVVVYESVYRIRKLITEIDEYAPERFLAVCKELTKVHEQVFRGKPKEILEKLNEENTKGEFVVILAPLNWK